MFVGDSNNLVSGEGTLPTLPSDLPFTHSVSDRKVPHVVAQLIVIKFLTKKNVWYAEIHILENASKVMASRVS